MAKNKIDPERVAALIVKIRESYTNMKLTLIEQKTLMLQVGVKPDDLGPVDKCIEYFEEKELNF